MTADPQTIHVGYVKQTDPWDLLNEARETLEVAEFMLKRNGKPLGSQLCGDMAKRITEAMP